MMLGDTRSALAMVACLFISNGCSSDSSNAEPDDAGAPQSDGGDEGAGGSEGQGDAADSGSSLDGAAASAGRTVTVTGMVVESPAFTPYAGAVGCVLDSDPPVCSESGPEGMFSIELPANSKTGVTFDVPDMIPFVNPITTGDQDIDLAGRGEWSNGVISVVVPAVWNDVDPANGQVDFIATRINGGTVTTDATALDGWWLVDGALVTPDAGSPSGGFVLHGFKELTPGMATFHAEKDGQPCEWDPVLGPADPPGSITVPVRAGSWTRLFEVACP